MTAPGGKFLAKLKGENPDVPDASAMLSKQQQRQPPGATRGTGADTAGMIGAESELAPKLEKIASKGLDKAEEILDLPLDPDNPGTFGPTLRAQTTVRQIDLMPADPMGDTATALTLHPGDNHPSQAGMEYYAREMYRRM